MEKANIKILKWTLKLFYTFQIFFNLGKFWFYFNFYLNFILLEIS